MAKKVPNPIIYEHISKVRNYLTKAAKIISKRAKNHDKSKLKEPEFSTYTKHFFELRTTPEDSPGYKVLKEKVNKGLLHHFLQNSHHPEFYIESQKEGEDWNPIAQMNLFDLLEMIADWKAETPNIDSLARRMQESQQRYNIAPQLLNVLVNTVKILEEK